MFFIVVIAEKELASLRTPDFIKKRDELSKLLEQEAALLEQVLTSVSDG